MARGAGLEKAEEAGMSGAAPSRLAYPWDVAPEAGTTREVAPGVYWLCMRLPFALNHINLWLLADGPKDRPTGWTIVDTGVANDETKAQWERIFAERLNGLPVIRVICTHFHGDHFGLAGWLCERWGVDLWMTAGEFFSARAIYAAERPNDSVARDAFYRASGIDEAGLRSIDQPVRTFQRMAPVLPPSFHRISGGVPIEIGGHAWLPVIGRGHAPEHACLWSPDLNVLIGGDILLPRISPNVSVRYDEPAANPLRDYLDCLGGFSHIPGETLILPAHGLPYRGVHTRISDLRSHHAERLDSLLAALEKPRAATDCFSLLFRREIEPGMGLVFAVGESLAHLHYLEWEGVARRARDPSGIWRFHRA
jgi:glyoxylase-like metal-dependent hydrolase (beta-lactamase superfamily II)